MIEYRDPALSEAFYAQRLATSCSLAAHLLSPEFVRHIALYWLGNYTNYEQAEHEEDMFNDLVAQLLRQRPALRLHVGEGMVHSGCNTYTYPSFVQLLGNGRHALPMEYFELTRHCTLFAALRSLVLDTQHAFDQRVPVGLRGELELGGFVHDCVLEYFYEPVFLVTTLYMYHLALLMSVTGGRSLEDWLPRHYHSLRAINEEALAEANCLGDQRRLEQVRTELRALHDALDTSDLKEALERVTEMWNTKATYCYAEIFVRIAALCVTKASK